MNVLVLGCGRLGARLTRDALHEGHNVSIIDKDPASFSRLPTDIQAVIVLGTGIDEDIQRSAGVESADTFIAVTDNDNTNIMAAQIAQRVFDIEHVILRVYDPVRAETYRRLGLTVICPTVMVAELVEQEIPGFHPSGAFHG